MRVLPLDSLLPEFTEGQLAGAKSGLERLTPREREVLIRSIEGETSVLMAALLSVSTRTIEHHRQSALKKLQAHNMVEAVGLIAEIERLDDGNKVDPTRP